MNSYSGLILIYTHTHTLSLSLSPAVLRLPRVQSSFSSSPILVSHEMFLKGHKQKQLPASSPPVRSFPRLPFASLQRPLHFAPPLPSLSNHLRYSRPSAHGSHEQGEKEKKRTVDLVVQSSCNGPMVLPSLRLLQLLQLAFSAPLCHSVPLLTLVEWL